MQTFQRRLGRLAGLLPARGRDHEFANSVMEHLGVPTFALSADRRVMLWNKACEELTGVQAREVLGTPRHWRAFYDNARPCLADLVLTRRVEHVERLYAGGGGRSRDGHGFSAENWCKMPRLGRRLYLAAEATPIYDGAGVVIGAVEVLRDLTVEKQRQTELESLAALDGLTGLLNRRSFDERLTQEVRRAFRIQHPLALLMVDVDDFKPYNDAHGHLMGDECLRRIALAIREALPRAGDIAARYGGDEFAVILPDTDRMGALRVAERVRERVDELGVANPFSTTSRTVTLSIGACVTSYAFDGSAERLVALADAELYRAKRSGRSRTLIAEFDAAPAKFAEPGAGRPEPLSPRAPLASGQPG